MPLRRTVTAPRPGAHPWNRSAIAAALTIALSLGWAAATGAADLSTFATVMLVRDARLLKIVIKPLPPATPGLYPIPPGTVLGEDPTLSDVADLSVFIYNGTGGSLTDPLTAGQWTRLGSVPVSPAAYKYKNAGAPGGGPVKLIIVKPNVIKILAADDGTLLPGPIGSADVGVSLVVGTTNYCAGSEAGVEKLNDADKWRYTDNAPPGVCPIPSASTTSTLATSTTSTTIGGTCCPGFAFHSFTVSSVPGDCGDAITTSGGLFSNIACGGLHLGGGGNAVPLPVTLPDTTKLVTGLGACVGPAASLQATSAATTGSNVTCTDVGCKFGAPVPVLLGGPGVEDLDFCMVGTVDGPLSGSLDCATGEEELTLPVRWDFHLTNATTDPGHVIPGSQPCPICQSGSCIGGPNDGMACTAQTSTLGPQYPTSHDCPPFPGSLDGSATVSLKLTSGSVTWTATTATNDTEVEFNMSRVFSGFCRDADATGLSTSQLCWENGMAVGPACAGTTETCEQRENGAFGANGGAVKTITVIGSPQSGISGGPAAGTLVTLFSMPTPGEFGNVDNLFSLGGPGALAIRGTGALCATANPCP